MTKHTNERCIHVQNCEICLDNDEAGGEKKELNFWSISELFQFLPLPAEYRETSGSCSGHLCESTFSFSCIRLVRTCTEASFEKPGKMQSVPLHFQVTVHTVKNFSKPG